VSSVESQDGDVELSSISVLPKQSGKGLARMLISSFIEAAQTKGYRSIYLATDADGNERVNAFYQRQGFQIAHSRFQGQRKMNVLRLYLTTEAE
jgi:ribosomal protein S18 acetylase RimI-like enzyme